MELFTMKRYDDGVENENFETNNEDYLLQKLNEKAKKKKRQIEETEENAYEEIQSNAFTAENNENNLLELDSDNQQEIKKIKLDKEQQNDMNTEATTEQDNKEKIHENVHEEKESYLKVLGNDVFQKKQKIDMVLPAWLAHPTIIANKILEDDDKVDRKNIDDLKFLSPKIKEALHIIKIEKLFPVQQEVIPWILNAHSKPPPFRPRDICVSAPTGSGKTLAFAIPIVQLLEKRVERKIRALIVLPVSELASQVYRVFNSLTNRTNLSVCLLSKSFPLPAEQQKLIEFYNGKYHSKVDIIVTTPGRLVEHIHSTKGFSLNSLKFLVIDEADRIMEQIHHNWLYHLDNNVRDTSDMLLSGKSFQLCVNDLRNGAFKQPHKLLFSATLSQDPEKLQNLHLFQPKLFTSVVASPEELFIKIKEKTSVDDKNNSDNNEIRGEFIGKYTTPAELTEKYCITEGYLKPLTLYSLIKENAWQKFLCFTNSAESAHRLSFVLKGMFRNNAIAELSANLKPSQRNSILNSFSIGKIKGLISSDALARGIDIPEVDIVISYEVPRHIKTYIHRIGRTGRAGRPGTAITLLSANEFTKLNKTLSEAGKELMNEVKVESDIEVEYAKQYSIILEKLKKELEKEKKLKSVYKDVISRKAIPVSGELSLTERLQIQANEIIANQLQKKIEDQEMRSNKRRHGKKFTANKVEVSNSKIPEN